MRMLIALALIASIVLAVAIAVRRGRPKRGRKASPSSGQIDLFGRDRADGREVSEEAPKANDPAG